MVKYKRNLILLALILIGMLSFNSMVYGEKFNPYDLNLKIDGKSVRFTEEMGYPLLIKNTERTVVPIRIIAENMGYDVDWEQSTKTAFIKGGGVNVSLKIGENTAIVNGKRVPIDVQDGKPVDTQAMLVPVKGTSRTYVPLRFIAEATGAEVKYERKNGINYIEILTGKEIIDEPEDKGEIVTTKQAKTIVGDGKEVTALADKYRYSYMNLGRGHYFDYKQNQKDGFIEPVIQITDSYGDDWFGIGIINREEYKGKGYEIRIESKYVKNTNWKKADLWGYSFPKSYGGKTGETVKYEISIRNGNKVKTYPFVITLDARKNVDEFGNAHKIEH